MLYPSASVRLGQSFTLLNSLEEGMVRYQRNIIMYVGLVITCWLFPTYWLFPTGVGKKVCQYYMQPVADVCNLRNFSVSPLDI